MVGEYLYYTKINMNKPTGIQKKILYQIQALNSGANKCEIHYIESKKNSQFRFILSKIPFFGKDYNKWIYDSKLNDLDYLYVRRPSVFDGEFVKYLKRIKGNNPNIKIVVELPTYPYDKEYLGRVGKICLLIDKLNRKKLAEVVDRFAVVAWPGESNAIWNIPVLPIYNGIDLKAVTVKQGAKRCGNKINLLCIAYFSPWHGFDKFILGLSEYGKESHEYDITLHMVGTGPELPKYKELVEKLHLQEYVVFYGEMNEGLDELYETMDIGVCSVNSGQFGVKLSSQLKSREYLAKGLPVITAGDIDVLQDADFPYECIVDPQKPIDFHKIAQFYENNILEEADKAVKDIRSFAEEYCSWEAAMGSVLEYLGMKE